MKGHNSSRPLRERTKERRVRLKTNSQRPSLRREMNLEKGSQDSESAYHTHEASDSIADRNSSVEQDSNGHKDKRENSISDKLDISPKIVLPCDTDTVSKVEDFLKKTESQESDFPKDSNSEDEKLVVINDGCEKKRHSQSISSENEDEDSIPKVTPDESSNLCKKINFEGQSHLEKGSKENSFDSHKSDENISSGKECLKEQKHTEDSEGSFLNISLESSPVTEKLNGATDQKEEAIEISSQGEDVKSSCPSSLKLGNQNDYLCKSSERKTSTNHSAHSVSSVHFTKDLVQLREITPKSSREGTPTHTQSDVLLQTKRNLRGVCQNSDTESESDNNIASSKILPNVRRRKINLPDSSDSILRNRRQPSLTLRDSKTNSTTGVSSSEGETEGQSSEYSRCSRKVSHIF